MAINLPLQQLLDSEINRGEKVLWSGQPDAKRAVLQSMIIFVFALPWTVFSINFMFKWSQRAGLDFASVIFQGSFVLVGFAMLSVPFWIYSKSRRTVYALTDKRILIVGGGKSKTIESYDQDSIGDIVRTERADGSGDLTFAQKFTRDSDGDQRKTDIMFIGIPEVRRVENLLRSTFTKSEL
jgi:hypothetical protein